jgi:hypothetical protein
MCREIIKIYNDCPHPAHVIHVGWARCADSRDRPFLEYCCDVIKYTFEELEDLRELAVEILLHTCEECDKIIAVKKERVRREAEQQGDSSKDGASKDGASKDGASKDGASKGGASKGGSNKNGSSKCDPNKMNK